MTLFETMYSKLTDDEQQNYPLVVFNFNKRKIINTKNKFVYNIAICANSTEKEYLENNLDCKNFFDKITIFTIENIINIIRTLMLKNFCVIMNPPYDKSLHLKILNVMCSIPECKKIINISPYRWLLDPFGKFSKTSNFNKYKKIIDVTENIDLVTDKESQKIFETAEFGMDLGIYTIGNGGYNPANLFHKFLNPIFEYMYNNKAPFEENQKDGIRIRIPTIKSKGANGSGHRKIIPAKDFKFLGNLFIFIDGIKDGKPWYDWYGKNQHSKTTPYITNSIKFNSIQEAQNFIDSTNLLFFKFVSKYTLIDVNIDNYRVLWMQDYIQPWTNKRFCDYFNITGYISDTEAEPNSEWEMILKEMSK